MRVDVEQELSGRMLIVTMEDEVGDFGVKMLKRQKIPNVLAPNIHRVDGGTQYLYEVKDWIRLREYIAHNPPSLSLVMDMVSQIICAIEAIEKYFLDKSNLLLQVDHIFWDANNKVLQIAYVEGYGEPVENGLAKIAELFMDRMEHTDKKLVFFVYALHRVCKEKPFQMSHLKELLSERQRIEEADERKQEIPKSPQIQEKPVVIKKEKKKRNTYFYKSIFLLGIVFFCVAVCYRLGFLWDRSRDKLDMWKMGGLILAVVCIGIYIWDRLERRREGGPIVQMETHVTPVEPVILLAKDWQRPSIKIDHSPFIIGSDYGLSDGWIEDNHVSRVHAKYILEEGGMFIIDQESNEGTFVNDKQTIPWERVKVHIGDEIAFADVRYKIQKDS